MALFFGKTRLQRCCHLLGAVPDLIEERGINADGKHFRLLLHQLILDLEKFLRGTAPDESYETPLELLCADLRYCHPRAIQLVEYAQYGYGFWRRF
jgi:hypothetical protein